MVASPNVAYLVEGKGGCDEDAADGSTKVARVLAERLTATGVTPEIIEFMCDSDYARSWTPASRRAGLSQATTRKTRKQARRWGGQAGEDFDPCYHEACDVMDNIDVKALDRYTRAVAGTVTYFAISLSGLPAR